MLRVVLEGARVRGVEFERAGKRARVDARCEVVLCAGSINSPQLLMLSGIGPGAELHRLGLKVEKDLPGVGANLMDHLFIDMYWECIAPVSVQPYTRWPGRWIAGLQWLLFKTGAAARTQGEANGFMRSKPGVGYPDIQVGFLTAAILSPDVRRALSIPLVRHGFSAHLGALRPVSRGRVWLRSADPHDAPKIFFNYLAVTEDWEGIRAAIRLSREVFRPPVFDAYRGREIFPGDDVTKDEDIDAFVREHAATNFMPRGLVGWGWTKWR